MLTVEQIPDVKKKIDALKEKRARAEGAIENIRRRWKEEFKCESKEAVDEKIKELEVEVVEVDRRIGVLLEKIDKAYDWGTM